MKLPNRENASVSPQKLEAYLLSETHAVGRFKARFLGALGFDETNMDMLERGLLVIAHTEEVTNVVSSPYGTKYVLGGPLQTPADSQVQIRTVWIVDAGQDRPRFVTAYPV
ncbi:MAG: hypothetical protein HYY04_09660 [Chloroflexi bacterium]|nr:hypothetical protein [Chloroflexota bacterium]